MRPWFLLILAVLLSAAVTPSARSATPAPSSSPTEAVHELSLITLLGNPEAYDDKLVAVTGFLNLEFEGDALYVSKADYEAMLTKNAVWIDGPKFEEPAARARLDNRYVVVVGRFDAGQRGHLGLFSASVENVSSIGIHPTRREIALISRPDFYTAWLPWAWDIPWPLILTVLWLWTIILLLVRNREERSGWIWIRPATLALAIVLSIFTAVRIQGSALAAWTLATGLMARDLYTDLSVLEVILGLLGLVVLWIFYRGRRPKMVMVACVILLLAPTAVEAVRFNGWAPVSETSPWRRDGEWTRTRPGPSYEDRIEF